MPKIEFTPSISAGTIITLILAGLGMAVVWGEKNSDVRMLTESDSSHEVDIRALEVNQAKIITRLDSIKDTVDKIEKRLP